MMILPSEIAFMQKTWYPVHLFVIFVLVSGVFSNAPSSLRPMRGRRRVHRTVTLCMLKLPTAWSASSLTGRGGSAAQRCSTPKDPISSGGCAEAAMQSHAVPCSPMQWHASQVEQRVQFCVAGALCGRQPGRQRHVLLRWQCCRQGFAAGRAGRVTSGRT